MKKEPFYRSVVFVFNHRLTHGIMVFFMNNLIGLNVECPIDISGYCLKRFVCF